MNDVRTIVQKLCDGADITRDEIIFLLNNRDKDTADLLAEKASAVSKGIYGNKVYIRGLIEFTNYCKNDCYYCGIRCSNKNASRYRLSEEEITGCASCG